MKVNFSHYEYMTQHTGQWSKIIALVNSQDDIGVMLRAHLLLEKSLEAWCICASGNDMFFADFGPDTVLNFAAKNQLAKNFGLSESLRKFISKFNRFRNDRAHRIESMDIQQNEIDSLTSLMRCDYPEDMLSMDVFGLEVAESRKVYFKDNSTSLRDKLIMLFSMLLIRMNKEAKLLALKQGYQQNYYGHDMK